MPLDKDGLRTAIKDTFNSAYAQNWSQDQVATALANAIDTYVRSGDIVHVTVQVTDPTNKVIGTGTQTGVGKIQ
jgi:hypothetical protein